MRNWLVAIFVFALAIGGLAIAGAAQNVAEQSAPDRSASPVAVELFTSQGCSSCPPADSLLARLARHPNVVAITRPVTLWDRLGWRDTLARSENTSLQQAYAARIGGGSGVYTPQAVVQGGAAEVGSDERALEALIAAAHARGGPAMTIVPTGDGGQAITISGTARRPATLILVALRSSVLVSIGRGENTGHSVRYTNVVLGERVIGDWTGGTGHFAVSASLVHFPGADRAALLLRQGDAGPILAARYL